VRPLKTPNNDPWRAAGHSRGVGMHTSSSPQKKNDVLLLAVQVDIENFDDQKLIGSVLSAGVSWC
jgi:hypothetical protein